MEEVSQKERLILFQQFLGISVRSFEARVGMSNGSLCKTRNVSKNLLDKVCIAFPELNRIWLLTGEGSMLRNNDNETYESNENKETYENNETNDHTLPLIPIAAVAGFNGLDIPGIPLAQCPQYSIPDFIEQKAEYLIRVSGSSMYPKYSSGDILACRRIQEITFIQWGKIYVIDSQQGAMVKRLFEIPDNPEHILCQSDNPKYPPFQLPKSEIRSLSIVVGVIRME